ncbi:terminase gpA endonuclease subunit, partial [Enterococcus faecium]|uniref:terminase gpA endonuclease subunit n=1 Tax=Enterococcus faecium TaxID=1352 RepID=UPI003DA0253F
MTAFVDVQNDRLEMMVMAWGPIGERALVDYVRISGELKFPEVQAALVQAIERKYAHGLGVDLPIHIVGIDSGYQT